MSGHPAAGLLTTSFLSHPLLLVNIADKIDHRRIPLLTNAALAALKCTPPAPSLAVKLATRALAQEKLTPAEQGKALYRRALGRIALKEEEEAQVDLKEAAKVVPGDAGISKALKDAEARAKARKDKERAAYSKMFG